MSPRFILGRENVPCVAEVVNRSLKADCTDFTAYSDERQNLVNSITRSFPNIILFHKNKLFSIIFECNEQHSKLISSSVQKFNEIRNEKIEIRENAIIPAWLFD